MNGEVIQQVGENQYRCYVRGKGEPLVLLHGFTGSSQSWESFIEKWSSAFKVIAIDLPGHGHTNTPAFPSMIQFCDELRNILQALNIKQCHLLGYSMGGRIALSFAERHPQHVASLMLESASPGLSTDVERKERQKMDRALAERIMEKGVPAFVEEWENLPLFKTQKTLPIDTQHRLREERLQQKADGLSQSLVQMGTGSQPSWWERLNALDMPVQLIVGGLDSKFVRINQQMEAAINHSELVIVDDAGHAVHIEQAEKFATIVMEFLYFSR